MKKLILAWLATMCLALVSSPAATLVPTASTWQYLKGLAEASSPDPTAWREIGFNDSSWLSGAAPFFYENGTGYTGNTELNDMSGGYTCIFMRKTFQVSGVADIAQLQITLRSDDGCIVWINGTEVQRVNMPDGDIPFSGTSNGASGEPNVVDNGAIDNAQSFLVEGENVIAVQAFNASFSGSSDFLIEASLTSVSFDFVPPTISNIAPTPGALNELTSVTVTFSEEVQGVNAGDLLISGFPANNMTGGPQIYTFTFFQPPYGLVGFDWAEGHGIRDFGFPPNPFDGQAPGATWQYDLVDNINPEVASLAPPDGLVVRSLTQIDVQFTENVVGVNAGDLLINNVPATGVTAFPGALFSFTFPSPATGVVTVAWAPGHGITDQATVPNPLITETYGYVLDPNAPPPELVLNEILAGNQTGLLDEFGENSDWIEIWNRGGSAVDLGGWSLSDDANVPGKWVFPSVVLGAGEYLVVFASGRDIKEPAPGNRFHTNFRMGGFGEHIGLYSPDSPRQPALGVFGDFPEQRNDFSYGLAADGEIRYFSTPSPGGPNGNSDIVDVVAPVHFSVRRGRFNAPFTLHLSTETPNATIYYTTDGSVPTQANGTPYLAPLRIEDTTLLRAVAFRPNYLSSRPGTHTYFFSLADDNLDSRFKSLPIISIVTDTNHIYGPTGIIGIKGGSGPPDNEWVSGGPGTYHNPQSSLNSRDGGKPWERPTSIEWIEEDGDGFQVDCGIRVHGSNWTRPRYVANEKFAFKIYMRGDYGPGRLEFPWFPESVDSSLDEVVLRDGHNDGRNPFIIDELIRRLHADMGQVASHGTFGNMILNGEPMDDTFRGQPENFYFNPVNRVKEAFLQAWHGGGDSWDIIGPFGDSQGGGDRVAWNAMESFIRGNNFDSDANYQSALELLDMVNFVDYLLVNVYGATWDWPHNNWRAARERVPEGIWRFYVWDAEGAFYTQGRSHTYNNFTDTSQGLADTEEIATFYQRLKAHPENRLLWADRIQKHFFNGGALMQSNVVRRFEEMRILLSGVLPNMDLRIRDTWAALRQPVIFSQFESQGLLAPVEAPTLSRHGGAVPAGFQVTMSAPEGTIYYTTDGTDPRVMFAGTASPAATIYNSGSSITLNQSVILKARAFGQDGWSALTEAEFEVGFLGLPIRITEIMYNPIGGNPAHEYIEIQNVGPTPIDVGELEIQGVNFVFPLDTILAPGQIILLASNDDPAAFASRYPATLVFAEFGGSLSDGGERLSIVDKAGNVIHSVDYDDEGGWPTEPDGGGYSLEIIDPLGAPSEPSNWRASLVANGSPGVANGASPASQIVINEIMAENLTAVTNVSTLPDYVELHNVSGGSVDISGWSLTDNGNPVQFVFPANTTIAANDYLVIWCDDTTNTTPGLHAGFALSRGGETVSLYDDQGARMDAVTFGLQIADFSAGLINGSWTLNTPTPDAANSAASLASGSMLTLNEWQANPLPGDDDWIELYNKSQTLPVSLQGIYLRGGDTIHLVSSLSFVGPGGFVQLFADRGTGPDHLDFNLPASGGSIELYDAMAVSVESVTYGAMLEGASRGRLPDGASFIRDFPTSPSPEAPNFVPVYNGPVINELLARNAFATTNADGRVADWVELRNDAGAPVDLSGMSLSIDEPDPTQWYFPAGTQIPANGYLILWCDGDMPATTNLGGLLNIGRSLDGSSGGVYLFNASAQLVNSVEYGFQVEDMSLGLTSGQWRLQSAPTPGAANSSAASTGDTANLRINEWMANPDGGDDWFEIYNSDDLPVDMSGLYVTDNPSTSGTTNHLIAALSFIDAHGWVRWEASDDPGKGRNHVRFNLNGNGEMIRLYSPTFTIIDEISFGLQVEGVSEGRLPDGSETIETFPNSVSPERSNYLPTDLVINEALTHTDDPLEDAIELHNPSESDINIGGWYLSDSRRNFKKFRIPDNTIVPANGFAVFYENQFNDGSANAFALNSAHGGSIWLSQANAGGGLTGRRTVVEFEAAANGVSFGRQETVVGVDFVAMSQRSFGSDNPSSLAEFRTGTGLANPGPLVGPVVIHEIMYHPFDIFDGTSFVDNSRDEYIELLNISGETVLLYDPNVATNVWKLRGGVDFEFPSLSSIAAGESVLMVNFDPVLDAEALSAFRSAYPGLSESIQLFGPYRGKLNNKGDNIKLYRPDTPQGPTSPDPGFVPQILVDRVKFNDNPPWPVGDADGGGLSLQREMSNAYGNDPLHWVADLPTPGADNGPGIAARPVITMSPIDQSAFPGESAVFTVTATGPAPLTYQWQFNGNNISGATEKTLTIFPVAIPNDGSYRVIVSSEGSSAVSATARLNVTAPPIIVDPPQNFVVLPGTNVTFTVSAIGPAPLSYQWFKDGILLQNETGSSLSLSGVDGHDSGDYRVEVSNPNATVSATGNLNVIVAPIVINPLAPLQVRMVEGGDLPLSVTVSNTASRPVTFVWRQGFSRLHTNVVNGFTSFYTVRNVHTGGFNNNQISVSIANLAKPNPGLFDTHTNAIITLVADADMDQLPDEWEDANGLDSSDPNDATMDNDGDGVTNDKEFQAGTDPDDAESYLKVESLNVDGSGALIRFKATPGTTYTVQYRDNLENAPWTTLADVPFSTLGQEVVVSDPNAKSAKFRVYRLVTPKQ